MKRRGGGGGEKRETFLVSNKEYGHVETQTMQTADCADRADCADWVLFFYLYLNFLVKFLL